MRSTRVWFVLALAFVMSIPALASAQRGRGGALALRIDDDAARLLGAEGGGVKRPRGGRPSALPVTVRGGAGALSGLITKFANGRRFEGEVVLTRGRQRQALLSFDKAYATELTIPALEGRPGSFAVAVQIEPGGADVGPFEGQTSQGRGRSGGRLWARLRRAARRLAPASAELSADGLGEVEASAVDEVTVRHPRGGRINASAVWVTVDRDDAGDWIEAFEAGRRLGETELRYEKRRGGTLLELSGEHARITAAKPDYDSGGVRLRLELEDPSIRAPTQ